MERRRTIEVILMEHFNDAVQGVHCGPAKPGEVDKAVGYLTNWALGHSRYQKCRIVGDDQGCLTAHYSDEKGETTYVIGAILRESGEYSFHS